MSIARSVQLSKQISNRNESLRSNKVQVEQLPLRLNNELADIYLSAGIMQDSQGLDLLNVMSSKTLGNLLSTYGIFVPSGLDPKSRKGLSFIKRELRNINHVNPKIKTLGDLFKIDQKDIPEALIRNILTVEEKSQQEKMKERRVEEVIESQPKTRARRRGKAEMALVRRSETLAKSSTQESRALPVAPTVTEAKSRKTKRGLST